MRKSKTLTTILMIGAWSTVFVVALIALFMLLKSAPFLQQVGISALWHDSSWAPTEQLFNIMPMLAGSLLVSAGAVVLAGPMGILVAIFGRFYAPFWLAKVYRGLIELLAGVPSVVYGFWGLVVLVPLISALMPPGASVLAGSIVLGMMILPLVVLTTDTALVQTPEKWLAAADALALQRWSKVWHIVLPHAFPGIMAGVVLQMGRALGETMAVLMVCGNIVQIPTSIFEPVRTLTANIALEMAYATDIHQHALMASGLMLFAITVLLVLMGVRIKGKSHV